MGQRRHRRTVLGLLGVAALVTACSSADEPVLLVDLGEGPGSEVIALRANGDALEWIERTAGRVMTLDPGGTPSVAATIGVATAGERRGLLGHTVVDGRRFAAWTEPESERLVVGELLDGATRLVWEGTPTETRSISGHLEVLGGRLLLGIGDLTDWGREHGSGALVTLDPDGAPDQRPVVVSDGWNNPFAFIVEPTSGGGRILLADNAPDGGVERLAAIDVVNGVATATVVTGLPAPQRAPSAIVALPDGRYGVCGWLDGELRAYELADTGPSSDVGFERAGTIGACRTAATVTAAAEVVVATDDAIVRLPRP